MLSPALTELRRALIELATGAHTTDSLQESLGRSLAIYLVSMGLAERRPPNRIGLSDEGWSRYVEEVRP